MLENEQCCESWTPRKYIYAVKSRQRVELPTDCNLRGRILRGRTDSDFELLGDSQRSLVFIMGPDGLSDFTGVGDPLEALDKIGLTRSYVQGRIAQGYQFR